MERNKILITGATGNTGIEVIKILKDKGVNLVAALRDPEKDSRLLPEGIASVKFDFADPATYKPAMEGIRKIYLIRPPAISDVKKFIFPVIDVAIEAGVQHIVLLSLMGAESNSFVPHRKIEKYILTRGIAYTFIRPSFFMQNLSTTHREDIKKTHEICVPAGKGKTSFIDVRDISAVSALALSEDGHENKAYELSGSEALTYYEVADILSGVLNANITYTNPSMFAFYRRMRTYNHPFMFIIVMTALYTVSKLGLAGKISNEFQRLMGREPITFKQFAEDYKECWKN